MKLRFRHFWLFTASLALQFVCSEVAFSTQESPQTFTYQGRVFNAAGTTALTEPFTFRFQIYNPVVNCLLYQETQTYDTTSTEGVFSVSIGSSIADPGAKRTVGTDPGLSMATIFQNTSQVRAAGANCAGGYTPTAGDARVMRVTITPTGSGVADILSPDQTINSVPQAFAAETLQGYYPSSFVPTDATYITSANLDALFGRSGSVVNASTLHKHDDLYAKLSSVSSQDMGSGGIVTAGLVSVGTVTAIANTTLTVTTLSNSDAGIIVRAKNAGQTASLQEWQNSAGTALASLSNTGAFSAASVASTGAVSGTTITGSGAVTGATLVTSSAGTVAANAIKINSDDDTGIYSSAANTLDFATGGVNALSISSSQNATFSGTITSGAITSSGAINKVTITAPATGSTLTIADGKTLTANNSIQFSGTDATTMTFPATSATIARTDAANTFTGVQTMTSAALTTPVIAGAPAAGGALGYDTTQKALTHYSTSTAVVGKVPIVIGAGTGTQALTNTTTVDQDFTSLITLPANAISANKIYRISFSIEQVTGVSTANHSFYLKLGGSKMVNYAATNIGNSSTGSVGFVAMIFGTAAPGAAVNVYAGSFGNRFVSQVNTIDQPVALATNGALAITVGVNYDATGGTESNELQAWLIEELN